MVGQRGGLEWYPAKKLSLCTRGGMSCMRVMGGAKRSYSTDIEVGGIIETLSSDQSTQIYINKILAERIYNGLRFKDGRWGLQFISSGYR